MEVVGVALASVATIDLCLKYVQRHHCRFSSHSLTWPRYGNILVDSCATFRGAECQINERIVSVRSHWKRTSLQLQFLKRIWRSLDHEHQAIQSEILDILITKLKAAISILGGLEKPGDRSSPTRAAPTKTLKFVFVKEKLDRIIQDLARWQEMFDPSWFLIMRVADPVIDKELTGHGLENQEIKAALRIDASGFRNAAKDEPLQMQSIFLPGGGLEGAQISDIPYSSAKYVKRVGSDRWLIVDHLSCDVDADINTVTKDIRVLAKKLSCGNPHAFGILQCRGVVRVASDSGRGTLSFDFVFYAPPEFSHQPDTLRHVLISRTRQTLTRRIEFAKQLARSISYIHTLGFVHKNVRPETILGFPTQDSIPGRLFLVGFEQFRMADGRTLRKGDLVWERNLYRHPDRQGLRPEEIYTMLHDIYSLGVCLLEIGLWNSFVFYDQSRTVATPHGTLDLPPGSPVLESPLLVKQHLVSLAKSKLPDLMGEIYGEVVVNCLTCLDPDNPDFGDQSKFIDADGVLIGVKYIEKVCHWRDYVVWLCTDHYVGASQA